MKMANKSEIFRDDKIFRDDRVFVFKNQDLF